MRKWMALLLVLLALACNFPGLPDNWPSAAATSTTTPEIPQSDGEEVDDPQKGEPELPPPPLETPTEQGELPTPTITPSVTSTPTMTPTPTPTATATPEAVKPGPPLTFQDPSWELVAWERVPGTNDWQGTIRIHVNGGTPDYRAQLEDHPIVDGLDVPARWRLCSAMPATIRVWSADGQQAHTSIWVQEVGCSD
jgi:hypothetical protein